MGVLTYTEEKKNVRENGERHCGGNGVSGANELRFQYDGYFVGLY